MSINTPCTFEEHWKQGRLLNRASNITIFSLRFWVYKWANSFIHWHCFQVSDARAQHCRSRNKYAFKRTLSTPSAFLVFSLLLFFLIRNFSIRIFLSAFSYPHPPSAGIQSAFYRPRGLGRVSATEMYRSIEHVKFPKFQTGIFVQWIAPKILPNLVISNWLWWIKGVLLANQNRGNILNE